MSDTTYFLRLDDACPTMPDEPWARIEKAFDELGVRPIVGVIPDCQDVSMLTRSPDSRFWDRVRRWQDKKWTIALHGCHHKYHPDPPRHRSLVKLHKRGEFVGLPIDEQRRLIGKAWKIFKANGITPTIFMAPAHSFDEVTIEALLAETPIRSITDGFSFRPFKHLGMTWYPQQLWRLKKASAGTWTVCLHPSTMQGTQIDRFINDLPSFRPTICALDEWDGMIAERNVGDLLFEQGLLMQMQVLNGLRRAVKRSLGRG